MSPGSRARQAGWSLLESVVVVSIVGFMAVGFWNALALVESDQRGEQARDIRAEPVEAVCRQPGLAAPAQRHRLWRGHDKCDSAPWRCLPPCCFY